MPAWMAKYRPTEYTYKDTCIAIYKSQFLVRDFEEKEKLTLTTDVSA